MARFKKGKNKKENDLWAKAGGRSKLVKAFVTHGVGKGKANWSTLAVRIFNSHPPNAKLDKVAANHLGRGQKRRSKTGASNRPKFW